MVSADALQAAWQAQVEQFGPLVSVGAPVGDPADGPSTVVRVPIRFERGGVTLVASVNPAGELVGLTLAPPEASEPPPPWQPPPYADPERFTETDVTLGEGPLAVPGTLALPRAGLPVPALVVLGGSGPSDRDGTIAANKPLKDLSWGLATGGVAVLRFDKVTHAHPAEIKSDRDFTLADEYLPHAVAALRLLRAHSSIATGRVFLAGHSLGGTITPRIAAADPSVAGLVILAGGAQPLQWSVVRQVRYLARLDPATASTSQASLDALTAQAEQVDSPDLSAETPDERLPFGVPAAYWLDLRGYDPVATAAGLDTPMLICQGGRDYQVTVADDLARWQEGLRGRADVTVRVYPADNHLFCPGEGPSTPAELATPQHLDPQLVTDIHDWVTRHPG